MDDTNTNLNNSGSGFSTPNWGQQPVPGEKVPAGPQGPQGAPQGTPGSPTTAGSNEPVVQKDSLVAADLVDSLFNFSTIGTTTITPSTPYTSYSNSPNLRPSTVNDPIIAQKALQLVQNPSPDKVEQMATQYFDNYSQSVDNSLDKEIEETPEYTTNDPQVLALAEKNGVPVKVIIKNILQNQNDTFKELVSDTEKYPKDVADKLTAAHYFPEGRESLSPELKAKLTDLERQVKANVANDLGFSSDWDGLPTIVPDDFKATLMETFDTMFEKLLNEKIQEGSLSESDARTLKAMQAGLATGTPTLKNILAQIQAQMTAQLQAQFGFDVTMQAQLKGDVYYSNVINGDFAQAFIKKAQSWLPDNLSDAQKEALRQYSQNPNDPNIPASIKDLAKQISDQRKMLISAYPDGSSLPEELKGALTNLVEETTTEIIAKYGLDATWKTNMTSLYAPGVDPVGMKVAQNTLNMAQEIYQEALKAGEALPEGPEKDTYLNFLKVIGQALQNLQDTIYSMQAASSNVSKNANRAKLDAQLNDIDKQQRAADKCAEQAAKTRSLGPLGKIFEWLIKIIMMIICFMMGPIGFLIMAFLFVDSIASEATKGKGAVDLMMKGISDALPPGAAFALKLIISLIIAIASANIYLFCMFAFQETKMIQDVTKACGGDKMAQEIAAMVVDMVVQLALMIVVMIFTGGAAVSYVAARMGEVIAKSVAASLKSISKIMLIVRMAMFVVTMSLQITTSSIKVNNSLILANIDMIKGDAEKYSEEIQALITILKKLIAKLLAMLQGAGKDIAAISEQQGKKWSDASQISSDIFS